MSVESGHILQVSRTLYVGLLQQYVKGYVQALVDYQCDIQRIALEIWTITCCNEYFESTTLTCKPKLTKWEEQDIRGELIDMAVDRYSR